MTQSQEIKEKLSSKEIKEKFNQLGIAHLSFFGSYARNEANDNSDLDLVIELSPNNQVTLGTLDELQSILTKRINIKRVDFLTKRKISPYLKPFIEKDLITIF